MSESSAFGSIVVCMSSVSLSEDGPQKLQQQLQENEKKRKKNPRRQYHQARGAAAVL